MVRQSWEPALFPVLIRTSGGQQLYLSNPCEPCEGSGRQRYDHDDCGLCNGTGEVLTETGAVLVEFFTRHVSFTVNPR